LRAVLKSAIALDYPTDHFELLIADEMHNENSQQAVAEVNTISPFPVRFIPCRSSNRAHRLNQACSVAQGEILVFTDDDCILPPDWLRKLEAAMNGQHNIGAVGGTDVGLQSRPFDLALDWVLNSIVGSGGCRFRHGPRVGRFYPKLWNMAVPRNVAEEVALPSQNGIMNVFDDSLAVHEDVELMRRIAQSGRRIVYESSVRVSHYRDTNFHSFIGRNFNMARICRRERLHRIPHFFLAGAILLALVMGIAAIRLPAAGLVLLTGSAIYAVILAGCALAGGISKGSVRVAFYIPIMLAGVHLVRGLGFLFPARQREQRRGG